jgi:DNA anti-recombination protein RmuC
MLAPLERIKAMKNGQARALEKEYNEIVEKGRKLWEEIQPMADRCNAILEELRDAKVPFDEIALIFGNELEVETAGPDDKEVWG